MTALPTLTRINRETAAKLFAEFAPLFRHFGEQGVEYCLVGGLAIIAHCLAGNLDRFRATTDADIMVPDTYSNQDFASDYLKVYAVDPKHARAVYEALFGPEGFSELGQKENAFVNISFIGADEDLDGVSTPDFDVCRILNGRTLASLTRERIRIDGEDFWVASVADLLGMKRDTLKLYGADVSENPRPQDILDVKTLEDLEKAHG